MGNVLAFPARRRRRRPVATTPLFPAEIKLFPLTRYAGEVDRMARHLRSLPTSQQRSNAMFEYADRQWRRLSRVGVDDYALEVAVIEFASCVWAAVNRHERGGVA